MQAVKFIETVKWTSFGQAADLMEYGRCDGGCHFNALGSLKEIFIWELQ